MSQRNRLPFCPNRLRCVWVVALLLCVADSRAQDCDNIVAEAQKEYDAGRFSTAVRLLNLCEKVKEIPAEQRVFAYRLLALAHLAEDRVDEAKDAVKEILKLNCNYVGEPGQDPQPYQDLVAEVIEKGKCPKRPWPWIAAGAGVVTGTVFFIVSRGKSEPDKPLPEPPALP